MRKGKPLLLIVTGSFFFFFAGAFTAVTIQKITSENIIHAQKLAGLTYTRAETDSMTGLVNDHLRNIENMRKVALQNSVPPSYIFNPIPLGKKMSIVQKPFRVSDYSRTKLPVNQEELAWYTIGELSALIHSGQITSEKLTRFFLDRLRKYDHTLRCVVTYTDSLAMAQARQADRELASGKDRGMLHGIPFGIKDIFYTKGYRTTFGTPLFKDQIINVDASVVVKLRNAGAVMIAKLSTGELAMDDVWFGGQTLNPWDTVKGSSGSSAGPASAVSAGLVPFAIGSETWGSIISPATVCGVTALRPTFGRVSRYGAMTLSWTMDKIGPLCRNAEDCAIVLQAINGADELDYSVMDVPFNYNPVINLKKLRIGVLSKDFDKDKPSNKSFNEAALLLLKNAGATLVPVDLPDFPYMDMMLQLDCEAASAFEDLIFSNKDDQMVQQNSDRWPNILRAANLIPATEYIRATRLRYLLIQELEKVMSKVDVLIAPSLAGNNLEATNLTGHPAVVVPNGFIDPKTPASIVFIGQLFGEGELLAVAKKYQDATGFHRNHPKDFLR